LVRLRQSFDNYEIANANRFDMEFAGSFYPLCNFARSSALAARES
jgi:hypothetical protein